MHLSKREQKMAYVTISFPKESSAADVCKILVDRLQLANSEPYALYEVRAWFVDSRCIGTTDASDRKVRHGNATRIKDSEIVQTIKVCGGPL